MKHRSDNEWLHEIARKHFNGELDRAASMKAVAEVLARRFGISRVGIWRLEGERPSRSLHLLNLYELEKDLHSTEGVVHEREHSAYFEFIESNPLLVAPEARSHPYTAHFTPGYFEPHDIRSLMDAPIHSKGRICGVLCCEMTGKPHHWTEAEERAVLAATSLLSALVTFQQLEKEIEARSETILWQQAQITQSAQNVVIGDLTGGIAHEINTPLQVIQWKANRLIKLNKSGSLSPLELESELREVDCSAERIARIVRGLRLYAQSTSSDPIADSDLTTVIRDVLEISETGLTNYGIQVRLHLEENLRVPCRPRQIGQAVLGLLLNSKRAVSGAATRWIELRTRRSGSWAVIEIRDSTLRAATATLEEWNGPLADPGRSQDLSNHALSCVRAIVESHGGEISLSTGDEHPGLVIRLRSADTFQ